MTNNKILLKESNSILGILGFLGHKSKILYDVRLTVSKTLRRLRYYPCALRIVSEKANKKTDIIGGQTGKTC